VLYLSIRVPPPISGSMCGQSKVLQRCDIFYGERARGLYQLTLFGFVFICTRCEEEDESICHALLGCADSRDVWLTSPFLSIINGAPRDSFDNFFLWVYSHVTKEELSNICACLWACWMGRNKRVMENSPCDVNQLALSFCKKVAEYNNYMVKMSPGSRSPVQVFDSWQPPREDFIKGNFDANVGLGLSLVGWVLSYVMPRERSK
jgi:hypothetical protein